MLQSKHKVFISYHDANDGSYKESLLLLNRAYDLFVDASVDTGGIDDTLPDQRIREIIRDDYLRDSTVTIVLVGLETKKRKHVDWEIYSSMFDGTVNKKSGILVISCLKQGALHIRQHMATRRKARFIRITTRGCQSRAERITSRFIRICPTESQTTS